MFIAEAINMLVPEVTIAKPLSGTLVLRRLSFLSAIQTKSTTAVNRNAREYLGGI
jgi:hypothetical protein